MIDLIISLVLHKLGWILKQVESLEVSLKGCMQTIGQRLNAQEQNIKRGLNMSIELVECNQHLLISCVGWATTHMIYT